MFESGFFALAGLGAGSMFIVFILWALVWKGFALWIAAREKSKWWFIVMLVLNTVGILEIIYIFAFSKWGKEYFRKLKEKKAKNKETVVEAEEVKEE